MGPAGFMIQSFGQPFIQVAENLVDYHQEMKLVVQILSMSVLQLQGCPLYIRFPGYAVDKTGTVATDLCKSCSLKSAVHALPAAWSGSSPYLPLSQR